MALLRTFAGRALCLIHWYGVTRNRLAIVAIAVGNAIYRGIGFEDRVGIRYHTEIHRAAVVIIAIFAIMLAVALKLTHHLGRPWFAIPGALTYPLYLYARTSASSASATR